MFSFHHDLNIINFTLYFERTNFITKILYCAMLYFSVVIKKNGRQKWRREILKIKNRK